MLVLTKRLVKEDKSGNKICDLKFFAKKKPAASTSRHAGVTERLSAEVKVCRLTIMSKILEKKTLPGHPGL